MARIVGVTLFWEGPLQTPSTIARRPGILMVVAGQRRADGSWDESSCRLLHIGQSDGSDGPDMLATWEADWAQRKPANLDLFFAFAEMPADTYDEVDRHIVESCLRAHFSAPPSEHGNGSYERDDLIAISNQGYHLPLRDRYLCFPSSAN
jgi:hypothetical protein